LAIRNILDQTRVSAHVRPSLKEYFAVGAIIASGIAVIALATVRPIVPADVRELVLPMCAMFALTAAVWVLMVLARNGAVLLGFASMKYFHNFTTEQPDERIERPARTFNNLMQVPVLFYVISLLMIILRCVDASQVFLAWMYVVSRATHAIIYIGFNYVPFRFAVYAVSCITLGVMWVRFALSY
jgi:hypothetical protein